VAEVGPDGRLIAADNVIQEVVAAKCWLKGTIIHAKDDVRRCVLFGCTNHDHVDAESSAVSRKCLCPGIDARA